MSKSRWLLSTIVGLFLAGLVFVQTSNHALAACNYTGTDYGTVTSTMTVPTTKTYYVWARVQIDRSTAQNDSFLLEIDGNTCFNVQPDVNAANNTWVWTNLHDGMGASSGAMQASLATGSTHTIKMIGNTPNVKLDKVIFVDSSTCIPNNNRNTTTSPIVEPGSDCAEPDTHAPVVSITSVGTGTTKTVTISASDNQTGDTGVSTVEVYDGATKLGTATGPTAPAASGTWTYSWNTSTATLGTHNLTAKATDASGLSGSSAIFPVTISDTTNPNTVSVTSPTNCTTSTCAVSGTISLAGTAKDNVGVTKIDFIIDSTTTKTVTNSSPAANVAFPASTSLDTTTLSDGTHNVVAKAYDAQGNTTTSTPATSFFVTNTATPPADTTNPVVSITAPANGALISKDLTSPANINLKSSAYLVTATATDAGGIAKVVFSVDGVVKATDTTAPYSFNWDATTQSCTPAVGGLGTGHTITAVATDTAGNNATASIDVGVTFGGDIAGDCHVTISDYGLLASKFGQAGSFGRIDINGDGAVTIGDYGLLASKFGQ